MTATTEKTKKAITKFRHSAKDTGSSEVQISLLSERISHLTEHLKTHKKDFSTQRSLRMMVGRRTRLLRYLRRTKPQQYKKLVDALGLRK